VGEKSQKNAWQHYKAGAQGKTFKNEESPDSEYRHQPHQKGGKWATSGHRVILGSRGATTGRQEPTSESHGTLRRLPPSTNSSCPPHKPFMTECP